MAEYTIAAAVAVVAVVLLETRVWRTGLFRRTAWWVSLGICAFFMVLTNGWLTKLSAPIVLYDPERRLLGRFPWDIPVEDFLFGFSMLTLATLLWIRAGGVAREVAREVASEEVNGDVDENTF